MRAEPFPRVPPSTSGERLVVADFDQPGHRSNLGDPFGAWEADPDDQTQSCRIRLTDAERVEEQGYSLMIDYDVESPNPAYCGFWMKLPSIELSRFHALGLTVKGDAARGSTRRVKLELKDKARVAQCLLDGIEAKWTHFLVPLSAFDEITRLRRASEFVIVFDEETVTKKIGTLYIDEVTLE